MSSCNVNLDNLTMFVYKWFPFGCLTRGYFCDSRSLYKLC